MRNMGFGALYQIDLPCSLHQYEACYTRINMQRLSKIFRFQQKVNNFVLDNTAALEIKIGQKASLFSLYNNPNH